MGQARRGLARVVSPWALFGLEGVQGHTKRGLVTAFASSMTVIMGVNLISPILPAMMQQLAVEPSAIGLVIAAYTLPAILLSPVTGVVADLHGRRPLLVGGLALFGLSGVAAGMAPSFEWVLVFRALQGVGASALAPLTIVLIGDLVRDEEESAAQGMKVVLHRIATSLFPLLAGVLAVISWSFPFFMYALALLVALLALAWLPETRAAESSGLRAYVGNMGEIRRRPRLLFAFSAGALRFFLDYAYFTYLPIYLALTRGTSTATVGLLFICFAAGAMVTASQAGRLVRGREPTQLVLIGFVLSGISVLVIPLLPNEALVGASLFVYGLGNGIISPLQKSVLTRNAPPNVRGGVIAFDRLGQQIAKSLGPGLAGALLLVADLSVVFWALGALSLACVALAAPLVFSRWWAPLDRPQPVA
jgi:predicted MFS family arabinose efflux permease